MDQSAKDFQQMIDVPGWIQFLHRRSSASHALHTPFLLDLNKAHIAEAADSSVNGRRDLRRFALSALRADDPQDVALSLIYLCVVGEAQDLATVSEFAGHDSELVQRAARACQFELKRLERA